METNTEDPFGDGVLDSIMFVCDAHPCAGTHLAENDDDQVRSSKLTVAGSHSSLHTNRYRAFGSARPLARALPKLHWRAT